jgi:hypothetical protein
MRDPAVVAQGSASLAPELLPMEARNGLSASIARDMQRVGATCELPPRRVT